MKINKPNQAFQIVAHRGLSNHFPENTLVGFKAALMQHVDMLEIDVHFSKTIIWLLYMMTLLIELRMVKEK